MPAPGLPMENESALVVLVPEADSVVAPWRRRLDPPASVGVPAHVTILYPFVSPVQLDESLFAVMADLFGGFGPFDFELDDVRWFGEGVVWLAPRPAEPFMQLIDIARRRWPELPPYGRPDREPIPHVTVGQGVPLLEQLEAEAAIRPSLPIRAAVTAVSLLAMGQASRWELVRDFAL